ncbi:OmpA family protein [Pontibacter sp. KCTC 32443]|uniref:OmpA family protein n=1 Tax=Pontibacter TaxID=323449 RepID=UPI00164CFB15|nr:MULTISPECIES: OmpA family protein [Pontibacter]MBC5773670.1 OmpA family protein [Pontibacter sp. KCTC 32443]
MKTILLYLLFCLYIGQVKAQNLVRNPSLEELKNYIVGFRGVSGTPDIASKEDKVIQYPPYHNAYMSDSPTRHITSIRFGDICFCQWFSSTSSELMQAQLKKPLKKNTQYIVSLYTIRATVIEPPIREITVSFTQKPLPLNRKVYGQQDHTLTSEGIPYLSLTSAASPSLASRESWTKVTGVYKARGGEKYLLIGNFIGANSIELDALNPDSPRITRYNKIKGTYYCYDNISVIPVSAAANRSESAIPDPKPLSTKFAIGNTITLKDLNFKTGEFQILETAYLTLDSLAAFLKTKPEAVIAIQGHTDDVGSEEANLILSVQRAKAVMDYLLQKGIVAERMTSEGYGEAMPKADNLTIESRAINRRVEIKILHKKGT